MKSLPLDWNVVPTVPTHGVTRNTRLNGYMVALLLNRRQAYFGPYRESRTHAAMMHDRLLHYFLPFTKANPTPNCTAEVFNTLVRSETEELIGEKKLQRHYNRLKDEAELAGVNLVRAQQERRLFINEGCGLHAKVAKLTETVTRNRRKGLIALEVLALKSTINTGICSNIYLLNIPADKWTAVVPRFNVIVAKFEDAQAELRALIRDCKVALDLDPNSYTK